MDYEDYIDDICIGSFNINENLNEETVGNINFGGQLGECTVHVYSDEGQIPHVHVESKSGKFETCVCLNTNKHFIHGKYKDKFTNGKQKKAFDEFMNAPSKENPDMKNWEVSSMSWNLANTESQQMKWREGTVPNYKVMNDEAMVETKEDAEKRKKRDKSKKKKRRK